VLLEGMGYLPGQQLALLARPCTRAPVQTSWLRNFQGSMEASFVNYGMADARALPPKTARLSAERATLLPHQLLVNSHAYHIRQSQARESTLHSSQLVSPSSSPRQRRSALRTARGSSASDGFTPALTTARPLLCSLNRVNKLDPTVFDSWASALLRARVPLWVATGAGERTPSSRPASLHAGAHHGANPPLPTGDWTPRGRRYAQRALRAERGGMDVLTTTRPLPTGTRSAPSAPRWALAACAGMRCSPRRVRPMQVIPNLDCH
jgi:hypothetical protein